MRLEAWINLVWVGLDIVVATNNLLSIYFVINPLLSAQNSCTSLRALNIPVVSIILTPSLAETHMNVREKFA